MVLQTPGLLNSARYHRGFQNFVVPWKMHIYQKLILPADASQQDASNGVRVAFVIFYDMRVKNMVNSLPAIDGHDRQLFNELRARVVSP